MVFDLVTNFITLTPEEKAALLLDITINSVHIFCGLYGVDDKGSISLTNPEYRSVEPDFKEDEVWEAFRMNEALILNERHPAHRLQ